MQTKPEPYCPKCGAKMILRRPKPGQSWSPFWGCSQFPECKGTRQIDRETGKPEKIGDELDAYSYLERRRK